MAVGCRLSVDDGLGCWRAFRAISKASSDRLTRSRLEAVPVVEGANAGDCSCRGRWGRLLPTDEAEAEVLGARSPEISWPRLWEIFMAWALFAADIHYQLFGIVSRSLALKKSSITLSEIPEDLGGEQVEDAVGALPGVTVQPRLAAGVLQKGPAIPAIFDGNLG